MHANKAIAVLIPCHNEEATIHRVVTDFIQILPRARVYVFDNNSSDDTANIASRAGAIVQTVHHPGKGSVVQRMFADIDADIYLMVDGDDTYDARAAPGLINALIERQLDMVVAKREAPAAEEAFRKGHRYGNKLLTAVVQKIFRGQLVDMLSGYRALSRRFVKSFPCQSRGFEVETELTIHALELRMKIAEIPAPYGSRPEGSYSKLSTYKDGVRILLSIIKIYAYERPFSFYALVALALTTISLWIGAPVIMDYWETGLVPRLPTAVAASSLMVMAMLSLACGIVSHLVTISRRENKYLAYLAISKP